MGNQQERSLSWLAGIIDGEGTISVQVYTMPDGRVRITPFLCVVNSDEGILQEAWLVLSSLCESNKHGRPRMCTGTMPGKVSVSGCVTSLHTKTIRVDGIGIKPVVEALLPYLRSTQKSRAARVILEFLSIREATLIKRDHLGRIQRSGYTRAEVELICSIRSHKSAKSSEAICSAPNVVG